jgi:hypothetical protein
VSSQHEQNGPFPVAGFSDSVRQKIKRRMLKRCLTFRINHHGNLNIMNPPPKRLQNHLAAVELFKWHVL